MTFCQRCSLLGAEFLGVAICCLGSRPRGAVEESAWPPECETCHRHLGLHILFSSSSFSKSCVHMLLSKLTHRVTDWCVQLGAATCSRLRFCGPGASNLWRVARHSHPRSCLGRGSLAQRDLSSKCWKNSTPNPLGFRAGIHHCEASAGRICWVKVVLRKSTATKAMVALLQLMMVQKNRLLAEFKKKPANHGSWMMPLLIASVAWPEKVTMVGQQRTG